MKCFLRYFYGFIVTSFVLANNCATSNQIILPDMPSNFHLKQTSDGTIRHIRSPSAPKRKPRSDDGEVLGTKLLSSESDEEEDFNVNVAKKNNQTSVQMMWSLPEGYNKLQIPVRLISSKKNRIRGVDVEVSLFIRTILETNDKSGELVLDTDFGMKWKDWRIYDHLMKNNSKKRVTEEKQNNITLDPEVLKKIWKPDVFFDEMEAVEMTSLLSKLTTLTFLGDTGAADSGDIVYSSRCTLRLRCEMDFTYYPADTQTCHYHLRSNAYKEPQLTLHWAEPLGVFLDWPFDFNFYLMVESSEPKTKFKKFYVTEKFNKYRDGSYPALYFTIKARRKLLRHVVQTYLPSVMLIFITGLCFVLPGVETRVGISMTTLLTLTAMFSSVREQSPIVSYTMAIDIWMVFCIFLGFVALLLFTVIYWMKAQNARRNEILRKKQMAKKTVEEGEDGVNNGDHPDAEAESSIANDLKVYDKIVTVTKRYAFWTFALIFLTFFVCYWAWLLIYSGWYWDWNPSLEYNGPLDVEGEDDNHRYFYGGIPHGFKEEVSDADSSSDTTAVKMMEEIEKTTLKMMNGTG